ncbi:MAG: hypothetical protein AABY73_08840 [Pseudomonadota bacterium]
MIDDLIGFAAAAATDIAIDKAAKRSRWARILKMFGGLLFVALVIALIYVTVKYS